MKIITTALNGMNWRYQTIYLDARGRLVGCEDDQQCCENFSHEIYSPNPDFDWTTSFFTDPFIEVDPPEDLPGWKDFEGNITAFCVQDINAVRGYLLIGNEHNGYYSHEYQVRDGDRIIQTNWI